jgi:hypothetical protein
MAKQASIARTTAQVSPACRAGAALLIVVAIAAILVHGKTSRGPKPIFMETTETSRVVDRPQVH